jgi:zinc/manganese transport system permease protein
MFELLLPPLAACLVIVALHAYLGVHVLARGVIFVDLALAQMAALGGTVAILTGVDHDSPVTLVWSLGFTTFGALLFSLTRTSKHGRVPQEAIIGIVYVVAAAMAILVADRVPHGGEAIKEILVGNLLWVTWPTILTLAAIYAVIGALQFLLRRRFLTISLSPEEAAGNGWNIKAWDFAFYILFGVVITFSVPIAGVLLVFSFLVVPAAVAFQFTNKPGPLTVIAWIAGLTASAAGLAASFRWDLPTGPMVVVGFAAVLLSAWIVRMVVERWRTERS